MSSTGSCFCIAALTSTVVSAAVPLTSSATMGDGFPPLAETLSTVEQDPGAIHERKSEEVAMLLSATSTLGPVAVASLAPSGPSAALLGCGIFIGPSLGYFYGRCGRRGLGGIAFRAFVASAALGVTIAVNEDSRSEFPNVWPLSIGATVIACSALYDIGVVGSHVRKANERLSQDSSEASIEPILLPGARGQAVPGLAVRVSWK